jgi:hypothetical protein
MTEHVDMSAFIAARSDQLNADDLLDGPRTITVTKVTASPDAAEQPVSIHYEGDNGKPFKPCKTMRRILVGVWGKDASQYVGRSLTLYRDPTVAFGGLQVGGIRISHMSDIAEDKTVALLVTRGRKAPFKIKPLKGAPPRSQPDFTAQLAELKALAKPGNMDALGAKWQEIGADARKALAAELPALKAACEKQADDVPFSAGPDEAPDTNTNDAHPAEPKAAEIIAEIEAAGAIIDVNSIVSRHREDIEAMPGEIGARVEIAADKRKREIEASRKPVQGELA